MSAMGRTRSRFSVVRFSCIGMRIMTTRAPQMRKVAMSAPNVAVRPNVAEKMPPMAEPRNTMAPQLEPNNTLACRSSSSLFTKLGSAAPNAGTMATDNEDIAIWAANANQILASLANRKPTPHAACNIEIKMMVLRRSNLSTIGPAIGERKNDGNTYAA